MVIEKTKIKIKETGDVKPILQIRFQSKDIVIQKGDKKYIYPFGDFNYIPCYGIKKDINEWDIYHRDVLSFTTATGFEVPTQVIGVIFWNEPLAKWAIYDSGGTEYDPYEVTSIEVIGNEMNSNWQSWR
jgi:hypothetical protein